MRDRTGWWAFLVSVCFIPSIMSAAVMGRWALIAIGVPLMGEIRLNVRPAVQIAIAMGLAWACASLLVTPDKLEGAFELFFMIALIGTMGVASQVVSLDAAMTGLCIGCGVSSLFAVSMMLGHQLVAQGSTRYAGLFYNSEVFTEFAAPLLVWACVKKRVFLIPGTLLPVLINGSRISLFCAIIALVWAFWPKSWKWRAAVLGAGLAVAVAVVAYLSTGAYQDKFGSAALRIMTWLETAYAINPLGQGLGWFRASHKMEEFAHSDVIQAIAELGLGALCFALIPIYALRNRGDHAERAAFIVICIELVVSFPLHVPAGAFLAALLAGYLVRDCAGLRLLRPDGGSQDGPDGEWHRAIRGDADRRSGRGSFVVPLRHQTSGLPALGAGRSGTAGG